MSYEEEKQDRKIEQLEAEIERLRTENRELLHEIKDLSRIIDTGYKQLVCDRTGLNERQDLPEGIRRMAARIQELETDNINLETLNEGLLENGNDLRSRAQTAEARIQKLDALLNEADQCRRSLLDQVMQVSNQRDRAEVRIQELEDALAEYQRLGKIMEGRLPCLTLHGECERCSSRAKELCDAMHQIAEGKIGPSEEEIHKKMAELPSAHGAYKPAIRDEAIRQLDVKPRSWQITEERIRAIQMGLDYLEYAYAKSGRASVHVHAGQLRAMLGAGQ